MRNYMQAYSDVFKSGFIKESSIEKHIRQQATIDELLPESASFFYVVEIPSYKYHFLGKQQVNVSGYVNEAFLSEGVELFLKCIHPEDVDIVLNKVYPEVAKLIATLPWEDRKTIQIQYNYRFHRKDGECLNLMEQVYVLELDQCGAPALLLGNVIILDNNKSTEQIRLSCKRISDSGFSETFFSKTFRPYSYHFSSITDRELDILRNIASGKTSKEIGDELHISRHTVDTHRRNLLRKLNCKSVADLVNFAYKNCLL